MLKTLFLLYGVYNEVINYALISEQLLRKNRLKLYGLRFFKGGGCYG